MKSSRQGADGLGRAPSHQQGMHGVAVLVDMAQRGLGAARTSAHYAVGPFIGVTAAWVLFGVVPGAGFLAALVLMALWSWLSLPGH